MMTGNMKSALLRGASAGALALGLALGLATPSQAIVVRDDVGLGASTDPNDDWASLVQVFFQNNGTGGIFFNCSGTLINPRTVLTAAHCVNSNSSEAYGLPGAAPATMLIGFGPSTSGGLFSYINAGGNLPFSQGGVASSTDVIIHPSANLDNGGLPFPWADVALIALDEPVTSVPSMGMLFSPLQALTHVIQGGYGSFGTGDVGTIGIGFTRLIGENQLGLIGSSADLLDGVFPGFAPTAQTFGAETQTLYFTDFDDPTRTPEDTANCTFLPTGISCANLDAVKAIDWFDGDALPREVATAGGDSGSALIADEIHTAPLILGVLSGGFDFFGTGNLYGDISFYNPLFPFHEFISANTPYKYVSAIAGDGSWTDPNHWTQDLDPGFFIIDENGAIVNGLPEGPEDGVYTTTPKIGTVLGGDISGNGTAPSPFLPPREAALDAAITNGTSEAVAIDDIASLNPVTDIPADTYTGSPVDAQTPLPADAIQIGSLAPSAETDDGAATQDVPGFGNNLPQSSSLQGPGSTGFVPNNTDGTPGIAFANPALYFDVTLMADGTTTLSGADIEIDQLTLMGGGAALLIENASLTSLVSTQVLLGTLTIGDGGTLNTPITVNDFGIIGGTGTLDTLALFNTGGMMAPGGGASNLGSLDITGTFVQHGNGVVWIEAGRDVADSLDIGGAAFLDGTLFVTAGADGGPARGSAFEIISAAEGVFGTFANELTQYTAVLSFDVNYGLDNVSLSAFAADYRDVIGSSATPQAWEVAGAFDAATDPDALPSGGFGQVIAALDASPTADILAGALHSLNPVETFVFDRLAFQTSRAVGGTLMNRAATVRRGGLGHIEMSGLDLARGQTAASDIDAATFLSAANAFEENTRRDEERREWSMPHDMGAFITGDITSGEIDSVNGAFDTLNYWITAGADKAFGESIIIGAAINYGAFDAEADTAMAEGSTYGLSAYASIVEGGFHLDAYAGLNWLDLESARQIFTGVAEADVEGSQTLAGFDLGYRLEVRPGISIGPLVRMRHTSVTIDAYDETGAGPFGAALPERDAEQTLLGLGGTVHAILGDTGQTLIFGRLTYENDLSGTDTFATTGALVSAPQAAFLVSGLSVDDSFLAFGGGISSRVSDWVSLNASVETDFQRDDADETRMSLGMTVDF